MPVQRWYVRRFGGSWHGRYRVVVDGGRELLVSLDERDGQGLSVYFSPVYERGTTAVVRWLLQPGDAFVDVGANLGWYATLARDLVGVDGQVCAFEPHPVAFRDLELNLTDDRLGISARQLAIGRKDGSALLVTDEGDSIDQSFITTHGRQGGHRVEVQPLDTALAALLEGRPPRCTVVKVDVEGTETDVVAGARRVITTLRPIWLIECNPAAAARSGHRASDPFRALEGEGYDRFYAVDMRRNPARWAFPVVEALRPGKTTRVRGVEPTELDGAPEDYLENIACLSSRHHHEAVAELDRHTTWRSVVMR